MISMDFECEKQHRFEGCFKDYQAFQDQLERGMVQCPMCSTSEVKRIFRGCSIQSKSGYKSEKSEANMFQVMREINTFVRSNFRDVGTSFADTARAIHYGVSEDKNVYGQATPEEIKELVDEGIAVMPLIDPDPIEN